jgi:hypothetical protein
MVKRFEFCASVHRSISQMKHQLDATFLQGHSTCFGRKRPSSGVPVAAVLVLNTPDDGRLRPKHVE